MLLPSIVSPYGIYLARIYAAAAVPDAVIEAARTDGAGEFRIFRPVALPMMVPGLVTVFLFQFVAIWNNFLLPFIMLGDDHKFPLTRRPVHAANQGNPAGAVQPGDHRAAAVDHPAGRAVPVAAAVLAGRPVSAER